MAKTLDFNAIERPVLEITMRDKARTVVRVTTPTEGLLQRTLSASKELEAITQANDPEVIASLYDLYAEIMSCNADSRKITGADLREKYGLTLYDLIIFTGAYLDFVHDIKSAKN